jgi:hypothetical protein
VEPLKYHDGILVIFDNENYKSVLGALQIAITSDKKNSIQYMNAAKHIIESKLEIDRIERMLES